VTFVDIRPVEFFENVIIAATIVKRREFPIFGRRKHDMKNSLNCLEGEIVQPITNSDNHAQ